MLRARPPPRVQNKQKEQEGRNTNDAGEFNTRVRTNRTKEETPRKLAAPSLINHGLNHQALMRHAPRRNALSYQGVSKISAGTKSV